MQAATLDSLRRQLTDRQARLRGVISRGEDERELVQLLEQVDSALARMDDNEYARCLVCNEDVEERDLLQNPLLQYCLCNLNPDQQRALEHDLQLARRIQAGLLPEPHLVARGWEAYFRYEPLGMVSGDFCDLWTRPDEPGTVYFAVGDVSGKGVAASLLMAHLQAAFRSLLESGVPLSRLVEQVNRQLLRASIPSHYATLVCGRLNEGGEVEMVNAGHCPPLVARSGGMESIGPTGFPVGLVADRPYELSRLYLSEGETLVLYTDGLTEARLQTHEEFGEERLQRLVSQHAPRSTPRELVLTIRQNLTSFLGNSPVVDDLTILVVQRAASHR
jgi:sigma-B regulation protein RsbU (phosphoserine phosphatase)